MSTSPAATPPNKRFPTIGAAQARLGHVPEERILSVPGPGTATVQDLLDGAVTEGRVCELVDGILVEKPMGFLDDLIGTRLIRLIGNYLDENNVGEVAGAQGLVRFKLDLVRVPDVSFIRWDSVDDPALIENPAGAFLDVVPDLVAEVISPSNTRREMKVKLREYAEAGVKLVWYIDPERREIDVYPHANPKRKTTLGLSHTLDGGDVLPGFAVQVAKLFESRAPRKGVRKPKK